MPDDRPSDLSRRFEEFRATLQPRLDRVEEELKATPIHVMVFGPGKNGRLYPKRQQIRDALNQLPGVTAYFPEQSEFAEPFRQRFRISKEDAVTLEILQAQEADVIIALEPGSGAAQEVALFSQRERLAVKLFNLLPKEYEASPNSFAGQLRAGITRHYYTPAELRECALATRIVVEHVIRKQIQKRLL